jgi:hypothetical protein
MDQVISSRSNPANVEAGPVNWGDIVSVIIEMYAQEIQAIKQLTRVENDAEAITQAAREFLRINRLRELKNASGKVDFQSHWQALEDVEFDEAPLPQ